MNFNTTALQAAQSQLKAVQRKLDDAKEWPDMFSAKQVFIWQEQQKELQAEVQV